MNKFMLAFALGTGLTLSLAAPTVHADPMIQTLSPDTVSPATFNSLFQPVDNAPVLSQPFMLANAGGNGQTAGTINSRCSRAPATPPASTPTPTRSRSCRRRSTATTSAPMHVDGTSFLFNGNPISTSVLGPNVVVVPGQRRHGRRPDPAGQRHRSRLALLPGQRHGNQHDRLAAGQLRRPGNEVPPLNPGDNSATFVVLSNQTFSQSFVNVTELDAPDRRADAVYAPDGTVFPSPVPEPSTILAWAGWPVPWPSSAASARAVPRVA